MQKYYEQYRYINTFDMAELCDFYSPLLSYLYGHEILQSAQTTEIS
jgi:hypothetical protein